LHFAKIEKVKLDLKTRSKSTYGNFKQKLERNANKLLQVEEKLVIQPNSARHNNWHYRLIKQREKMHLFNQKYWGRLARKDWLVNGDRNSRYFHQAMKARNRVLLLLKLKTHQVSGSTMLSIFNSCLLITSNYGSNQR